MRFTVFFESVYEAFDEKTWKYITVREPYTDDNWKQLVISRVHEENRKCFSEFTGKLKKAKPPKKLQHGALRLLLCSFAQQPERYNFTLQKQVKENRCSLKIPIGSAFITLNKGKCAV